MDTPRLCFLSGAPLPLSRPTQSLRSTTFTSAQRSVRQTRSKPLIHHQRTVLQANASDAAESVDDRVSRETPSRPDVTFGSIPSVLRNIISTGVILASATGAYQATPSNIKASSIIKPTVAVTTAIAVAGTGMITLKNGPFKAAKKHLSQSLLKNGIASTEFISDVENLAKKFGITDEQVTEIKVSMYQMYLVALVNNEKVEFLELSQLSRLKESLKLSGSQIGTCHYEASREFYRTNIIYLDSIDDEENSLKSQSKLNKVLFLSDRMYIDKDENEEAYLYEKSRLINFFRMNEVEYFNRISKIALPFYNDVVIRASKDSSISKGDLQIAQSTLGVKQSDCQSLHIDMYKKQINKFITENGKLDSSSISELDRLKGVFGIDNEIAADALKNLAEPTYRAEVKKALDAVTNNESSESMASIYGRLALKQQELSYPSDAARLTMSQEMTERADEILKLASKYLRVQNVSACIKQIDVLLKYLDGVIGLIRVSNDDLNDDNMIIKTFLLDASNKLSSVEPKQMYRLYLSKCLEDRKISSNEEVLLIRLRSLLNIKEHEALEAYSLATSPVYKKAIMESIKDDIYTEENKTLIQTLRTDLSLPETTWKQIELDIYYEKLRNIVDGNRIIQETEAQQLFSFRDFLGLTEQDTASIHKKVMGPVYEQSVTEAMGPTGIMLDQYRAGLERLRTRLGLTEEDAEDSFHRVVKRRMLIYVNRALEQLEKRQAYRGQNEERDMGEDPNIKRAGAFLGIDAGGLPIELANLVDFYMRNGIAKEEEVENESGEKTKVQKYPLNLRGDISPKVYNELYKQYVIQCFSAQTRSEKQRLFAVLDQLGNILGLKEDEIGKIHSEIGTVIYKNYLNQALVKGPLEDKDMEFLDNIEKMLSMKAEQCKNLLKDGKDNRVSIMLEQIFAQPKVLAETVRKMRAMASALEVDIVKDLQISDDQRGRLFGVEIDAAIDTGALTADNQGLIKELQESLQVSDDVAKEIVLACIQKRSLSHLVQAAASLRQERSETAVAELKSMLRYGKLLPAKVIAPAVSIQEKQELYLLFQADVITDGVVDNASRELVNLLKTMFGFSDADLEVLA